MRRQIYGGNIKHIEPHHVGSVNVPRLGDALERRVQELIDESTSLLNEYESGVRHATSVLLDSVGLRDVAPHEWRADGPELGFSVSKVTSRSLRALNHSPRARRLASDIKKGSWKTLGEICIPGTLKGGGRFKRIDAAPDHSYLLVGQKDIFSVRPEGRWIARASVGDSVLVPPGTVLIAAQGTLGESELYCRTQFIWGRALKSAYSQHFIRAIAAEEVMPRGCLYAFLRSERAFRLLRSVSIGTKLQDLHPALRCDLPVPFPERVTRNEVHALVVRAYEARDRAVAKEEDAIRLVECAIENGVAN
jgi:type I restriction enzyme S subunit